MYDCDIRYDVWRYYTEDAVYSVIDGTRYEAKGQTQIRELFDNLEAPETRNEKNDDGGDCRSVIVQSVVTARCPSGQLLVVATTEMFTQSFVVEYIAPGSFAVMASVVMVKRDGADPHTPNTHICRRRRRRRRRVKDAADDADTANATGTRPTNITCLSARKSPLFFVFCYVLWALIVPNQ
ncbi:NTF2 domain-containing protein [Aphis craccivora]|uniref:NTF2 domain-containing protein n=1 Tax=Aphis craccivora TaxID=307492 RepID=A0A6G0Z751_APHCR|nr:NTF2 domain-containing protein [Aphis craccivora]